MQFQAQSKRPCKSIRAKTLETKGLGGGVSMPSDKM